LALQTPLFQTMHLIILYLLQTPKRIKEIKEAKLSQEPRWKQKIDTLLWEDQNKKNEIMKKLIQIIHHQALVLQILNPCG
jgi:hypothetical protein